jgi:site-specific recombinase XerD
VLRRAEKLSRLSQQGPVTAIRSLLRFLTFEGQIRAGLEGAVPPLRGSRHASIPRHLSSEQLDFVLTLCPADNALDKRNRAMLLLLARLGLRAGEVFRVSLDNLNWTGGAVLIRSSKTARERILPMPEDVGTSLAAYLTKGRPASSERLVFLSHHPPYQPLRSTGVLSSFVNSLLKPSALARNDPGLLTKPDPGGPPSAGMITPSLPAVCGLRHGVSCGTLYPSTSGSFLASAED